jgi:hypothetical protein
MKDKSFLFPKKVYLSGADWFLHVLDNASDKKRFDFNIIRIVLDVEDENYATTIINRLKQHDLVNWMLNIQLKNPFFFSKPYWKYKNSTNVLTVNYHELGQNSLYDLKLFQQVMRVNKTPLFTCDCVKVNGVVSKIVLSIHHVLMDGRGASFFLEELHANDFSLKAPLNVLQYFPKEKAPKISWYGHVKNMYFIKYFMYQHQSQKNANFNNVSSNSFKIRVVNFNQDESLQINNNGQLKGAKFGLNQFLLAVSIKEITELFREKNIQGDCWLPIPYDGRKRGGNGPIISNAISFLFYRIKQAEQKSIEVIVKEIQFQMMDQLRQDLPKKYSLFLEMMRYIPEKLFSFLILRASAGNLASFLYSASIEQTRDVANKFELQAKNMHIIPPFSFPPGLTISFLTFNGQLSLNLVYDEALLNESELLAIIARLKIKLLAI